MTTVWFLKLYFLIRGIEGISSLLLVYKKNSSTYILRELFKLTLKFSVIGAVGNTASLKKRKGAGILLINPLSSINVLEPLEHLVLVDPSCLVPSSIFMSDITSFHDYFFPLIIKFM